MNVRPVAKADHKEWLRMRAALWPDANVKQMRAEIVEFASDKRFAAFVLDRGDGELGGFAEISIRHYANGCKTRDVGFLEGWYVDPDLRKAGWGRKLVKAGETWARKQGCSEMGSDSHTWNRSSIAAHLRVGFREHSRTVNFVKSL